MEGRPLVNRKLKEMSETREKRDIARRLNSGDREYRDAWERKVGRKKKVQNGSSSLEACTVQYVYAVSYATSLPTPTGSF